MRDDATLRCAGCGYDLRGLPENRCPECGLAFDPRASSPRNPRSMKAVVRDLLASLGLFGASAAAGICTGLSWWPSASSATTLAIIVIIASTVVNTWMLIRSIRFVWQGNVTPAGEIVVAFTCMVAGMQLLLGLFGLGTLGH